MARPGLRLRPKFRRLVYLLKLPGVYVQAHLQSMWEVGYETGDPRIGDALDVELAAEWEGEPGVLFNALLATRWIDEVAEGVYHIHDLLDHAPDYVRKRARRLAATRNKDLRQDSADNGAERRPLRPGARTTAPIPSPPIPAHPLKEKSSSELAETPASEPELRPPRQAENSQSRESAAEPQPHAAATRATPSSPASPPTASVATPATSGALEFPVVGPGSARGASVWPLPASKRAEYAQCYPGIDVDRELLQALQWCRDNPKRRKTAVGMPRFLASWLGRAQDRGPPRDRPGVIPSSDRFAHKIEEELCRIRSRNGRPDTQISSG